MKLVKYKFSGIKKSDKEQETHCEVCKDGEIFDEDRFFRCYSLGSYLKEFMCEKCNTKYLLPKYDFHAHIMEGEKMNNGWIKAKPFKTSEGTFEINYHRTSNTAQVMHRGAMVTGTLSYVVNYIAQAGIDFKKENISSSTPPPPPMSIPKPPESIPAPPPPPMDVPKPLDMDTPRPPSISNPQMAMPPPPPPTINVYGMVGN